MEDSFRVRVDRAFGSLSTTTSASATTLRSLWSLTDVELDRDEWIRDKDVPEAESDSLQADSDSNFRSEIENGMDELDDDEQSHARPDDCNDEEWEIKKSIGLDSTLEYEEEEDKYDKVAIGKDNIGERLYLRDIHDYGIDIDSVNELPSSFKDATRDPRANHLAAKIRLKEDAEAAKKMCCLQVTEKDFVANPDYEQNKMSKDVNLKSILKRKDDDSDSKLQNNQQNLKSQKRVRFDPACNKGEASELGGVEDVQMETDSTIDASVSPLPPDYPSGVPDYMRNPSKYTRYTFDETDDVDDKSNQQACMDFLNMLKKSKNKETLPDDESSADLSKPHIFIPKKKTGNGIKKDTLLEAKLNEEVNTGKESMLKRGLLHGIAAGCTNEGEGCTMEEDEPEPTASGRNSSWTPGRRYRSKVKLDTDEAT
ncbi:hypothetical protein K2173_013494 [Erythroxylum novogranatense]|uniref:U5 small nuclear ribonucleoprotein TSSC4 n=1 Tax=Erythroxylum novogranatense TaxID=1862640 RepID=A0AAV8SLD1_9ROSI|nr:hypothetical protein K2173_013494 [Erythroxylum novogranatense]